MADTTESNSILGLQNLLSAAVISSAD